MTGYAVLGQSKNLIGWVYGDNDQEALNNLRTCSAVSCFSESPFYLASPNWSEFQVLNLRTGEREES